jgi:hypothetical protein
MRTFDRIKMEIAQEPINALKIFSTETHQMYKEMDENQQALTGKSFVNLRINRSPAVY